MRILERGSSVSQSLNGSVGRWRQREVRVVCEGWLPWGVPGNEPKCDPFDWRLRYSDWLEGPSSLRAVMACLFREMGSFGFNRNFGDCNYRGEGWHDAGRVSCCSLRQNWSDVLRRARGAFTRDAMTKLASLLSPERHRFIHTWKRGCLRSHELRAASCSSSTDRSFPQTCIVGVSALLLPV